MERGARVALLDVAPQPPASIREKFGPAPLLFGGVDLSDLESTRRVMDVTAMRFGGIDVLVNVAGGFRWETLEDGDVETWDQLYAMNLRTAVVCCKTVLPAMLERGGGRIINIGAAAAARAGAGMGAYTASKAGRAAPDREPERGTEGSRHHGQRDPARHHRHAAQSRRHAGRRFHALGRAARRSPA